MRCAENIEYKELTPTYEDYRQLRESVGWANFSEIQKREALAATSSICSFNM